MNLDNFLSKLRARVFNKGIYYRMSLWVDYEYCCSESEVTLGISLSGSKSRRQANNFVSGKASKLGLKTNNVSQGRGLFLEMFKTLLEELDLSSLPEKVFLNLNGADAKRTRVYARVLERAGYSVYLNFKGVLTMQLK